MYVHTYITRIYDNNFLGNKAFPRCFMFLLIYPTLIDIFTHMYVCVCVCMNLIQEEQFLMIEISFDSH